MGFDGSWGSATPTSPAETCIFTFNNGNSYYMNASGSAPSGTSVVSLQTDYYGTDANGKNPGDPGYLPTIYCSDPYGSLYGTSIDPNGNLYWTGTVINQEVFCNYYTNQSNNYNYFWSQTLTANVPDPIYGGTQPIDWTCYCKPGTTCRTGFLHCCTSIIRIN